MFQFPWIYFAFVILYKPAPCRLIAGVNSPENFPKTFPVHKSVTIQVFEKPRSFRFTATVVLGGGTGPEGFSVNTMNCTEAPAFCMAAALSIPARALKCV